MFNSAIRTALTKSLERKANQITKYLTGFAGYDFDKQTFEYQEGDFVNEFVRSISRDVYDNKQAFLNEIKERVKNTVLIGNVHTSI